LISVFVVLQTYRRQRINLLEVTRMEVFSWNKSLVASVDGCID